MAFCQLMFQHHFETKLPLPVILLQEFQPAFLSEKAKKLHRWSAANLHAYYR
jgi:hypothetical protein